MNERERLWAEALAAVRAVTNAEHGEPWFLDLTEAYARLDRLYSRARREGLPDRPQRRRDGGDGIEHHLHD